MRGPGGVTYPDPPSPSPSVPQVGVVASFQRSWKRTGSLLQEPAAAGCALRNAANHLDNCERLCDVEPYWRRVADDGPFGVFRRLLGLSAGYVVVLSRPSLAIHKGQLRLPLVNLLVLNPPSITGILADIPHIRLPASRERTILNDGDGTDTSKCCQSRYRAHLDHASVSGSRGRRMPKQMNETRRR